MGITIKRETPYTILFALCVGLPYINFYEVTFVVWSFAILVTLRKRYSLTITHYVGYFAAILLLAFIVGVLKEASVKAYDFIRDITYLLKPILGLLVGYQLCRNSMRNPMRVIVYTGAFIAATHLLVLLHAFA